jgi:hypothetical protein
MKIIAVEILDGIPVRHQADLYEAMRSCSNGQRLAVCLYLMSDLPDARHHLGDIERNYLKIFPPSVRHHYTPQDYKNFQASAIRFLFNRETKDVKEDLLSERQRLWTSPYRGYWRNTDLGHQVARQILRERGWLVQKGESVLNPVDEEIPHVERRYMEEELAREATAEIANEPEPDSAPIPENLLAHVDRILSALPEIEFDKLPEAVGPTLSTSGTPKEVLAVIRALADSLPANTVRLVLHLDSGGYRVGIETACGDSSLAVHNPPNQGCN